MKHLYQERVQVICHEGCNVALQCVNRSPEWTNQTLQTLALDTASHIVRSPILLEQEGEKSCCSLQAHC